MNHTFVVTGASRGIGRVAAMPIVRRSSEVHLRVVAREPAGDARLCRGTGGGRASGVVRPGGPRLTGERPPGRRRDPRAAA